MHVRTDLLHRAGCMAETDCDKLRHENQELKANNEELKANNEELKASASAVSFLGTGFNLNGVLVVIARLILSEEDLDYSRPHLDGALGGCEPLVTGTR